MTDYLQMNFKKTLNVVLTTLFLAGFVACNTRKNETDKQEKDSVNISDTSRNTTDTGNFLVDSSGD